MPQVIDALVAELGFDYTGRREAQEFVRTVDKVRNKMNDISRGAFALGKEFVAAGGLLTAAFGLAARSAIQWESDFTGVMKTVNATDAEFRQLEGDLRSMARDTIPLAAGELARIAELAGQLGIETANITEFVEVIAKLGTTTNLSTEEGAQALARFANITGMAQDDFDRLGATIVDLGNNFATTEQEIVAMGLRLAGAGDLVGLTQSQILGFATALTSVGINAEAGGTAFSRIFTEMQKAVQSGSEELTTFNRITGTNFGQLFETEGADVAIQAFIAGLQDMIDNGENVHEVLEQLGFDNVRIRDSILRSAGAGDLLTNALTRGTKAWDENVALTREADLRYGTMGSQIQFAKNRANELAITVGNALAPAFVDLLDRLEPVLKGFAEFAERNPVLVQAAALFAVTLTALGAALIGVSIAARTAAIATGGFQIAMTAANALAAFFTTTTLGIKVSLLAMATATKVATAATWLLNAALALNPIILVVLAVTALIAGLVILAAYVYRFREQIRALKDDVNDWFVGVGKFILDLAVNVGKGFINAIISGIKGGAGLLWSAVKDVFQTVRDFLPFSDAKEGPLSDLTKSGQSLVNTLAKGVKSAPPLSNALSTHLPIAPAPQPALSGAGGNTYTLTIDRIEIVASGGDPDTIAAGIQSAMGDAWRTLVEQADSQIRA